MKSHSILREPFQAREGFRREGLKVNLGNQKLG